MKSKLILGLLLASFSVAGAATINVGGVFSATSGLVGVSASGSVLSAGGYYIAVGSFASVPTISSDYANLEAAVDSMNIFASLTSPTATGNTQGTITGAFAGTGGGNASLYNGKQIYFVIGNGATRAASTDFAIFTSATNILFPADVTGSGTAAVSLSSITNSVVLANGGSEDAAGTARDQIRMVSAVPEPSAALLGAVGALGLLRRRRN